jgi:hypothetical protein
MNTPATPEQINSAIDNMTAICSKGRSQVRTLIGALFGLNLSGFKPNDVFELGKLVDADDVLYKKIVVTYTDKKDNRYGAFYVMDDGTLVISQEKFHNLDEDDMREMLRSVQAKRVGQFKFTI